MAASQGRCRRRGHLAASVGTEEGWPLAATRLYSRAPRPSSICSMTFCKRSVNSTFPTASRTLEGEELGQPRDAFLKELIVSELLYPSAKMCKHLQHVRCLLLKECYFCVQIFIRQIANQVSVTFCFLP